MLSNYAVSGRNGSSKTIGGIILHVASDMLKRHYVTATQAHGGHDDAKACAMSDTPGGSCDGGTRPRRDPYPSSSRTPARSSHRGALRQRGGARDLYVFAQKGRGRGLCNR